MLNIITIQGRLTRDPEIRYTQNQIPVTNFSLAVERDARAKNGDREVDFIECVCWRHTAEFASKYFSKGQMAIVSGRLQMNSYTDKEGQKRTRAEVKVDNLWFGESKKDKGASTGFTDLDDDDIDGSLPF